MSTAYSHEELQDLETALAELIMPAGADPTGSVMALSRLLEKNGVALPDQPDTVRQLASEWRQTLKCPSPLREGIVTAISQSSDPHVRAIARKFFGLHERLQSRLAMTFEGASIVTGYTSTIGSLAKDHSMSAAQIAALLRARGVADDTATWAAIQKVMSALSLATKVTLGEVKSQLERDLREEETLFADADWGGSLEIMAALGSNFGMRAGTHQYLASIVPESGEAHWPYVFMLHFSCVPLDWFDHAPVYLYEFSPRGRSAGFLLDQYEDFDTGKSNPFLNNAKSVDRIDQNWADSKTRMGLRRPASALVAVLEEAGSLPFQSKRAYGAALRQWCLRQLRLQRTPAKPLGMDLVEEQPLGRLLGAVAKSETNTRGIVEQRVVDALTLPTHAEPPWKPRGLSDSVNAANTPRRKLGDCEFQDSSRHIVEAYEAHAGHLSRTYFLNHQASLENILRARIDQEWLAYSDPSDWDVMVTFVSHSGDLSEPIDTEIEGVRVGFKFASYLELISDLDLASPQTQSSFGALLVDVLNHPRTPQSVRDRVEQLAG